MSTSPTYQYDVVIVGGGPAGTTCAMRLKAEGLENVLVLESGNYDRFLIGESLPPETSITLKKLGIYGEFLKETHEPSYGICSYWGDDRRGYNDTVLSPYGHGWHVDRRRVNEFLAEMAEQQGIHVFRNAALKELSQQDDGMYHLEYVRNGSHWQVRAPFVVDATGNKRTVAMQKGALPAYSSPLVCIARRYKLPKCSEVSSITRIEAAENGWWYGARLPKEEMLLGLYTTAEIVKAHRLQKESVWKSELAKVKSISEGLEEAEPIDEKLKGFHAPSCCLDRVVGKDWLAIGDAASCYDPITSRGVHKAMTDGLMAAEKIADHLSGQNAALLEFETYVKTNYRYYLEERAHYYQIEQRWHDSDFWSYMHKNTQEAVAVFN